MMPLREDTRMKTVYYWRMERCENSDRMINHSTIHDAQLFLQFWKICSGSRLCKIVAQPWKYCHETDSNEERFICKDILVATAVDVIFIEDRFQSKIVIL